jgi:hypothetical protein
MKEQAHQRCFESSPTGPQGGFMIKNILITTLIALSASQILVLSAFAATSNECVPQRYGKAKVKIQTLHWVQEKGSYRLESKVACTSQARVEIHPAGRSGDCLTPVLAQCKLTLDGNPHQLNVSGEIRVVDDTEKKKIFNAGYHLDRNSTEVKTGEAASTSVTTKDLGLKEIGLEIQSKLDGPSPGMSLRDAVNVIVDFEDTDAP